MISVKIPPVNPSFPECFVEIPVARLKILCENVHFFKLFPKKGTFWNFAKEIFDLKWFKTLILTDFGVLAGFIF